jgi:hypothetical protein
VIDEEPLEGGNAAGLEPAKKIARLRLSLAGLGFFA